MDTVVIGGAVAYDTPAVITMRIAVKSSANAGGADGETVEWLTPSKAASLLTESWIGFLLRNPSSLGIAQQVIGKALPVTG